MLYREAEKLREHQTPEDEQTRTVFRRDYARLIHSAAFRRLQGKTQLFPGLESDFFRNRLTHSLEVAQIAKSIALRSNNTVEFFREHPLDTDLVEVAGLFHDLGHPPFGHNGEKALDDCMKKHGGFEGNAQTLRILARIEKKVTRNDVNAQVINGLDQRLGLNLTYRTLAAALKYDNPIPRTRKNDAKLVKGYYQSEADLVGRIKQGVTGKGKFTGKFKTIECHIMDIADDIAYSTYDLEDAFKAGFLTPLSMLSLDSGLLVNIADKVGKNIGRAFSEDDVTRVLLNILGNLFELNQIPEAVHLIEAARSDADAMARLSTMTYRASLDLAQVGYLRTEFTSQLVDHFIRGVQIEINDVIPALSKAFLQEDVLNEVEVLKHLTYEALIMSSRLKVAEYRGYDIVTAIFEALTEKDGHLLLPDDYRYLFEQLKNKPEKMRTVCDFISGMTDRYAVEFFGRLRSENAQTIFKPL